MCLAVWAHEEEVDKIEPFAASLTADGLVTMILYQVRRDHPNYYDFPVNLLRNICIRHITTSHFMVLDIDMWPTARGTDILPLCCPPRWPRTRTPLWCPPFS